MTEVPVWTLNDPSLLSLPSEPQLLYELPKRAKAEKIEDALLCQSPLVREDFFHYS